MTPTAQRTDGRSRGNKRGATLVEVVLASGILLLVVLSLLEGFIVAARIARHANGAPLVADAYAYDLVWTLFNQRYSNISVDEAGTVYTIPARAAPALASDPTWPAPTARVRVTRVLEKRTDIGRQIAVDVEWGARGQRKVRHLEVLRSRFSRAPE